MNSNELRIGNLVSCGGEIVKVESIGEINGHEGINFTVGSGYYGDYEIEGMAFCNTNPIILTEEWLIKFGFTKSSGIFYKDEFELEPCGDNFRYLSSPYDTIIINVHSLQNLFFTLTQNELKLK